MDYRAKCEFFEGLGVYRKVKRHKNLSDVPTSFKFYPCQDVLARIEKKFAGITWQFELALYLINWLSEAIFTGGSGKEIRANTIYPACKMAFRVKFSLAPAMVVYLCSELQAVVFMARFWLSINRNFFEHIVYAWFVYHCKWTTFFGFAEYR